MYEKIRKWLPWVMIVLFIAVVYGPRWIDNATANRFGKPLFAYPLPEGTVLVSQDAARDGEGVITAALLLQIAMAERGSTGCVDCMALVMNTVLNRVADQRFPSSIRNVIYAQDQFTPVTDGTFAKAQPDDLCRDALERIIKGWDESQGALYYEWCQGESWHSKNLHLLFQHCDVRFYD